MAAYQSVLRQRIAAATWTTANGSATRVVQTTSSDFAVQLTTVRFIGTFLAEPTHMPSGVVAYVPAQRGIHDVACLADYARSATAWEQLLRVGGIGYDDNTS